MKLNRNSDHVPTDCAVNHYRKMFFVFPLYVVKVENEIIITLGA